MSIFKFLLRPSVYNVEQSPDPNKKPVGLMKNIILSVRTITQTRQREVRKETFAIKSPLY